LLFDTFYDIYRKKRRESEKASVKFEEERKRKKEEQKKQIREKVFKEMNFINN